MIMQTFVQVRHLVVDIPSLQFCPEFELFFVPKENGAMGEASLTPLYDQFWFGFGVSSFEGGKMGKRIDGWSPVKVLRKATILFVSSSANVPPS